MSDKNSVKISGFSKFLAGKGFYIVLLLCVAVVGVAAWAILFNPFESNVSTPNDLTVYTSGNIDNPEYTPTIDLPHYEQSTGSNIASSGSETPPDTVDVPPSDPPAADTAVTDEQASAVMAPSVAVETPPDHYVWPLSGNIELPYSVSALVYNRTMADWRTHPGIDITANIGVKVMAVASGSVSEIYEDDMYGTTVIISHGGDIESVYSNLASTPTVKVGDKVSLGDVIGAVGDTALCESADVTHLHFEMRSNDSTVDPLEYLPNR